MHYLFCSNVALNLNLRPVAFNPPNPPPLTRDHLGKPSPLSGPTATCLTAWRLRHESWPHWGELITSVKGNDPRRKQHFKKPGSWDAGFCPGPVINHKVSGAWFFFFFCALQWMIIFGVAASRPRPRLFLCELLTRERRLSTEQRGWRGKGVCDAGWPETQLRFEPKLDLVFFLPGRN